MNEEMTELAADYTEGEKFSEKSVEDDCDAILRMYAKRKEKQMNPEEKNKSPFWKLNLLKVSGDLFEKRQPDLNKVPEDIIYYLLIDLLQEQDSVQIDELLTMKGGPGKIMSLKRTMLIELLERLENQNKIIINHTAGLNMVYLNEKTDGNSVVRNYYEKHGEH